MMSCLKPCPGCLPMTAAPCAHTGLVDGWRAAGRAPSEPMFRAAFMSTTRLDLRSREAAAALLSLMRESLEVRTHAAPCYVQMQMPGGLVKGSLARPRLNYSVYMGAQVLVSQPSNGILRLASGCIAALGHPGAALRMLVSIPAPCCLYRKVVNRCVSSLAYWRLLRVTPTELPTHQLVQQHFAGCAYAAGWHPCLLLEYCTFGVLI